MTRVNFKRLCQKSDPYVLASQVQQIFYLEGLVDKTCHNVIKKLPRDWCEVESAEANEESRHDPVLNLENEVNEVQWSRDDVLITQIRIPPSQGQENIS